MTAANRRLLGLIAALSLTSGCELLRDTRPMVVEARDAETKQPIQGAEVSLSFANPPPGQSAYQTAAPSGPDGIARQQGAVPGDAGLLLTVSAKGYHSEHQSVDSMTVKAIPPLKPFETNTRPVQFIVELYADPDPTVDLVLPAGFRGLVKTEMVIRPDAPFKPGQRTFTAMVSPDGAVQIVGPPLLQHAFGPTFGMRFADGTPLSRRAEESAIGYWYITSNDYEKTQVFLVGTLLDFDTYRRTHQLQDGIAGGRRGGAVSGGGRGGRHRGGDNQQPSVPDPSATGS